MNYLITFEGIEGVGKSTQIKLLHDFIIKSGYSSQIIREPGSTPFGEDNAIHRPPAAIVG